MVSQHWINARQCVLTIRYCNCLLSKTLVFCTRNIFCRAGVVKYVRGDKERKMR